MKIQSRFHVFGLLLAVASFPSYAMTLDEYLGEVRQNNEGVRGAKLNVEARTLRRSEGSLFFKPSFFLNGEYSDDQRPTNAPSFQGTQTKRNTFRTGLSQNFRTGTKATLSYNVNKTEINGAGSGILAVDTFYDVYPQLELSQSLWRNWLGSEFEANEQAQIAQVEASRLNDQFSLKQLLIKAENAYWRLVFAEESLKVQEESLARAVKLRDWNASRMRNNLVDEADYLQAEAQLQSRELDKENALIELDTAQREFNSVRQSNESITLSNNSVSDRAFLLNASIPQKVGVREDVLVQMENQKTTIANSVLGNERNRPNLEVYGSYSMNGRDPKYDPALTQAMTNTRPWQVVGLRFTTPIDFGALSDYRKGYAQEKVAADLNSRRKVFEVDREYEILSRRFEEFKKRLKISKRMEEVQSKKLISEKKRFNQGRTTTFQVLQFEQDFANAQLLSIKNEQELVTTYNQLKLFSGVSHE